MAVKLTKDFQARLMALKKSGQKPCYIQAMAILSEMQLSLAPEMAIKFNVSKSLRDDSRIPNCLKYELPGGYRMVFQRVDGVPSEVLALFVGKHDDVDRFLDNHKGWIFDPDTYFLREMRLVSIEDTHTNVVVSPELKAIRSGPSDQPDRIPAFQSLGPELLSNAGVPADQIDPAMSILCADSLEMMGFLELLPLQTSDVLLSFLTGNEETRKEVTELLRGNRELHRSISEDMADALDESCDEFIDLRDLSEDQLAFDTLPLEDWMLFLHPDQKQFVTIAFNGPARLRGVSGSGKSVVSIHRARHNAREAIQAGETTHVLFLTFNRSLADLTDRQMTRLCNRAERMMIHVDTIDKWCRDYVVFRLGSLPVWDSHKVEEIWEGLVYDWRSVLKETNLCKGEIENPSQYKWNSDVQFLKEEIDYIFGKLIHEDSLSYLDCNRKGRGRPLLRRQREAVLSLYTVYTERLAAAQQFTSREINRTALKLLREGGESESGYHSIIVDEVQDLSEIDLQVCKQLASRCDDKLFLVGDGAQRIYTRGYSMKNLGINVVGRSFILKQNYRNTRQIMKVGNALLSAEGIGQYDDEPDIAQTAAIPSAHSGDTPLLMVAKSPSDEWAAIAKEVTYLTNKMNIPAHEICCLARSSWERSGLYHHLEARGIPCVEYKASGIGSEGYIKISSLHNSKGHEFRAVFVFGLFDGAVPIYGTNEPEDMEREAALLYVAVTRAKDLLYLSYPKRDQNGRDLEASRFLRSIHAYVETIALV